VIAVVRVSQVLELKTARPKWWQSTCPQLNSLKLVGVWVRVRVRIRVRA